MEASDQNEVKVSKSKSPVQKRPGGMTKRHSDPVQLKVATPDNFISYALQSGRAIEEIEKLIEFRNRELARLAELKFNESRAQFLKECPQIVKNKTAPVVTKDGKTWGGYTYSDLDNLVNTVKDAESRAGLSHRWEDSRNDKGEMVVTCILSHLDGHEVRTTLAWPSDKSGGKNDIQAMKSTISYLRRATLESCLGVSQGGDDNDGKDAPGNEPQQRGNGLDDDMFRTLLASVIKGTISVSQIAKQYSLTEEQRDTLQRNEPAKPGFESPTDELPFA